MGGGRFRTSSPLAHFSRAMASADDARLLGAAKDIANCIGSSSESAVALNIYDESTDDRPNGVELGDLLALLSHQPYTHRPYVGARSGTARTPVRPPPWRTPARLGSWFSGAPRPALRPSLGTAVGAHGRSTLDAAPSGGPNGGPLAPRRRVSLPRAAPGRRASRCVSSRSLRCAPWRSLRSSRRAMRRARSSLRSSATSSPRPPCPPRWVSSPRSGAPTP